MDTIKLVSWNIYRGMGLMKNPHSSLSHVIHNLRYFKTGLDQKGMGRIGQKINEMAPDILTLQEIDGGCFRNGNFDQVDYLCAHCTLPHTHFLPTKTKYNYFNEGIALLSKHKAEFSSKYFSTPGDIRGYIRAEISMKDKKITLFTSHLSAHESHALQRVNQLKKLSEEIKKIKGPVIVLGDFNCGPENEEFKMLVNDTGLHYLFSEPSYSSYNPHLSKDNILFSKHFLVKKSSILKTKASDHMLVYAELKLK